MKTIVFDSHSVSISGVRLMELTVKGHEPRGLVWKLICSRSRELKPIETRKNHKTTESQLNYNDTWKTFLQNDAVIYVKWTGF